jgi:AraC family transcriptional regulator
MSFEVKILEYPAKHLAGVKVRTDMQKSLEDCQRAWAMFMPRMNEVNSQPLESFGISVMINENDFNYWAALELAAGTSLPDGMQTVDISAGTYARCTVPSIEKLGDAYMYLYTGWLKTNPEFALNMESHCFELYPCNWNPSVGFEIYMPIRKA